jgi:predicted dithiol-disulfide oxidoreductase (DUF899 family)
VEAFLSVAQHRSFRKAAAELGVTPSAGSGTRSAGAPDPMPIWNILDMTPEGRGEDWHPKLDYAEGAK